MAYYAQIIYDIVIEVIVINDDTVNGEQFAHNLYGGVWVQTYLNNANKNYAGIGYKYDVTKQNFIAPQPFPSWTLNDKDIWQSPTPQPEAPPYTYWNEKLQKWIPYEL